MKNFKQLQIWSRSHQLTLDVYKLTQNFPKEELYGLVSQMRRSASSVPTNIAEGCGRNTDPDFARFLDNSMGSASELEYQLILAHDLGYLSSEHYESTNPRIHESTNSELVEIKRMLNAFIQTLRTKS